MIGLRRDELRDGFEIVAEGGRVIGFLWAFAGYWHVRVEGFETEHHALYDDAAVAALRLELAYRKAAA
jgi:hypothetical protein